MVVSISSVLSNNKALDKGNGTVDNAASLTGKTNGYVIFYGISSATFGYGKNIAGVVFITAGTSSSPDAVGGLTYTESIFWINGQASDATADAFLDEVLGFQLAEAQERILLRDTTRGELSGLSASSATPALQSR